jgi:glycogen debranching enzyme
MGQPYLHEHLTCVAAPATWLSRSSGQVRDGVDGLYVNDRRVLSRMVVTVDGREPTPLAATLVDARSAHFVAVARGVGDPGPDPTVTLHRRRVAEPDGGTETLTLVNRARAEVEVVVSVALAADLAAMGTVKAGEPVSVSVTELADGWKADDGAMVRVVATPAPERTAGTLSWRVAVPPRGEWTATLRVSRVDTPVAAVAEPPAPLRVTADDRRLTEMVAAGVRDLAALRLPDGPDVYYAAGSPWYLTLFGRDSLWAARMALPLGWEVALGTVRALARRQGTVDDPRTEEAPGKILHEVRPTDAATWLPPVYYGSVDATALFVTTLADAYRWGAPADAVRALLPNVERAVTWITAHTGFVAYRPPADRHHGLANQAWKDSGDGVQYADGRIAVAPLALSEVQAYAFSAAHDASWLMEALGGGDRPDGPGRSGGPALSGGPAHDGGPARWRAWADDLASRFRAAFWCPPGGTDPAYPAIALDVGGGRVDGPASNMGHLLGTGLVDAAESATIARWLGDDRLAAPFGLRTLATTAAGYNPVSYHAGSVWPHDTAIAMLGLARAEQPAAAARHLRALLDAAYRFDFRLPELYGGDDLPTPYPPSCRPQAWAAAVAPAMVTTLLGLEVDVPAGTLTLRPVTPAPVGAYRVRGLRVGTGVLDVDVDLDGRATVVSLPPGLTLR